MRIEPSRYYLTKNGFRTYVGYSFPENGSFYYIGHVKGDGIGPSFAAKWDETGYCYGAAADFDLVEEITGEQFAKTLGQGSRMMSKKDRKTINDFLAEAGIDLLSPTPVEGESRE